jgi:hypothetical protein
MIGFHPDAGESFSLSNLTGHLGTPVVPSLPCVVLLFLEFLF